MSASSTTEIANLALAAVGHNEQIASLETDTSTAADILRLQYPMRRKALLRAHPWNFAIRRATLAQLSAAPNHKWAHQYTLPVDCLRVLSTSWEEQGYNSRDPYMTAGLWDVSGTPYRVENNRLMCNEAGVSIEYVADVTDTTLFDAAFTDALVYAVAAAICMPLTSNSAAMERLYQLYERKLSEARVYDAQEGTPREIIDNNHWVQVRG